MSNHNRPVSASPRLTIGVSFQARLIAFFLLAFAAGGVIQPFLNLYLVEMGFNGTEVGVLQGYTALVMVIITPLLGWLADRTQRHRMLLGFIVVIKGLAAPAMLISTAWGWLAVTVSLRMVTSGVQDALMNRLTMAFLQQRGQIDFGRIRVWGAVSFATTSLLTGWLARDHSVSVLFPLAGVLGLLAASCVSGFPECITPHRITVSRSGSSDGSAPFHAHHSALWLLFTLLFITALGKSGFQTFAMIYITRGLGAGTDWVGLLGAAGSLAPIPAFLLSDLLIHRWGVSFTLSCGIGFTVISYVLLALVPASTWTLPVIILNGMGEALQLTGLVVLLGQSISPEQAATYQMLAQLTIPGLSGMLAQPVSGIIFDHFGGPMLFGLDALLVGAGLLIFMIGGYFVNFRQ